MDTRRGEAAGVRSEVLHRWSTARRIAFGSALATAMAIGTFPGYAFGVLGPHLVEEFRLTRLDLGLLSSAFFLTGAVLSLVAGRAVDRIGARRLMVFSFLILTAGVLAIAASPIYLLVVGFSAVSAVALATANPATNALVATHIPTGRRGLLMGSKQAGVQLGALFAGAVLAPLASIAGWRIALATTALISLGAVATALAFVPADPPRESSWRQAKWGSVAVEIRWLAAYAFLMGTASATVVGYLPLYLVETGGMTPVQAGQIIAVVGLIALVGRIAWAWVSERTGSYSLLLALFGVGGGAGAILIAGIHVVGPVLALPAAIALGATSMTWNSVGMMAVVSSSDRGTAGQASGFVLFGFYIGFVSSPVAFGWLVDLSGTYVWGWAAAALVFLSAAATAVIIGHRRAG